VTPTVLASGNQHGIRYRDQRATVVQVGATLREYEVAGFPVLDGFGAHEMAAAARGQVLMPWPNRLADGRYELDGETHQLPLSEPAQGNAIHGLVRWSTWDLQAVAASSVRLGHLLWPQPGYPFTLALELTYEVGAEGLIVTIGAQNVGPRPAPFGAGQHPYIRTELGVIDGSLLHLAAHSRLEADERLIPTGRRLSVPGTVYDFREPRPIGGLELDAAFTELERDADGRARATLQCADGSRRVTVWMDENFDYLMVFSGDTLAPAERRRSLAIEPMTCAPNAFNNRLGLRMLAPGERLSASWGIVVG
jgi:aldose 1-epimerase